MGSGSQSRTKLDCVTCLHSEEKGPKDVSRRGTRATRRVIPQVGSIGQ